MYSILQRSFYDYTADYDYNYDYDYDTEEVLKRRRKSKSPQDYDYDYDYGDDYAYEDDYCYNCAANVNSLPWIAFKNKYETSLTFPFFRLTRFIIQPHYGEGPQGPFKNNFTYFL